MHRSQRLRAVVRPGERCQDNCWVISPSCCRRRSNSAPAIPGMPISLTITPGSSRCSMASASQVLPTLNPSITIRQQTAQFVACMGSSSTYEGDLHSTAQASAVSATHVWIFANEGCSSRKGLSRLLAVTASSKDRKRRMLPISWDFHVFSAIK